MPSRTSDPRFPSRFRVRHVSGEAFVAESVRTVARSELTVMFCCQSRTGLRLAELAAGCLTIEGTAAHIECVCVSVGEVDGGELDRRLACRSMLVVIIYNVVAFEHSLKKRCNGNGSILLTLGEMATAQARARRCGDHEGASSPHPLGRAQLHRARER